MFSSDPSLPKRSFVNSREALEEEIERSFKLTYNQAKAHGFVKKLYEFVSRENEFCEIASAGGIIFKSKDKHKKFEESFRNKDEASLALGTSYKAFRCKLYLYNFTKAFNPHYYSNPYFTKVNPKLKLIALRKRDIVHRKAVEVNFDAASGPAPSHLEANNEKPSIKQRIQEIDDSLDAIWKEVQRLKASNEELRKLQEMENSLPQSEMRKSWSVDAPVVQPNDNQRMAEFSRAVVGFSSPHAVMEMHFGHLRSTPRYTIACMLGYSNVDVLQRNDAVDWGDWFLDWENTTAAEQAIKAFQMVAVKRLQVDPAFMKKAPLRVVLLQEGNKEYRKAVSLICEFSRQASHQVYQLKKGLSNKDLIGEDEGAPVFIEGRTITVVKNYGGYDYASTDLGSVWYFLNVGKADWIVFVADVNMPDRVEKFFYDAKCAGWLPADEKQDPKASHVVFRFVNVADEMQLVDLLDKAKTQCKAPLFERAKKEQWSAKELGQISKAIGCGAVKFSDLRNNMPSQYTFGYDEMLSVEGNTAVNLQFAHARICALSRNSGEEIEELDEVSLTNQISLIKLKR